ncbi:hypothetical protein GCM10009715_18670 [Paeniglutamicibacter psychrophenolicus]|uniref:Uncharacterized protein n=1 Tax=Paeniglutamicibacter psychrophenolicus TaxID=257454 RepID=A0ABS4WD26_9MICC|nr:hypothetical protein [Paeniglutamicibacter psychrophenolicus]MBP2374112.1 hypothetical protein [Paeniglutamicibacter psychrophenolicus]
MPAEQDAPRRKKPRRFTAPPQRVSESTLVGVFEMPHGSGRPAANAAGNPEAGTRPPKPAKKPGPAKTGPVLEQRATEDDPRRWGDADDDLGDWMKAQRPPHWD